MTEKKRIKNGQRVEWTTNLGNKHRGVVLVFVPGLVDAFGMSEWIAEDKPIGAVASIVDISRADRYIVRCRDEAVYGAGENLTHIRYRAPNATTVEKANPTAEREP